MIWSPRLALRITFEKKRPERRYNPRRKMFCMCRHRRWKAGKNDLAHLYGVLYRGGKQGWHLPVRTGYGQGKAASDPDVWGDGQSLLSLPDTGISLRGQRKRPGRHGGSLQKGSGGRDAVLSGRYSHQGGRHVPSECVAGGKIFFGGQLYEWQCLYGEHPGSPFVPW